MRYIFVLIFTFLLNCAYPQQNEIKLSPAQIEYIFINNNIELMAEKLNISIADANIVQAKLWDNPQISIGGMNLWSTKSQREEMTFPGSFAKHTQFTAELSQIISVSGDRKSVV